MTRQNKLKVVITKVTPLPTLKTLNEITNMQINGNPYFALASTPRVLTPRGANYVVYRPGVSGIDTVVIDGKRIECDAAFDAAQFEIIERENKLPVYR